MEGSIREFQEPGAHIVSFSGELDLDSAPALCVHLHRARRNGARVVVLDLSELTFCDSQGLRALIGADRELRAAGKRLRVVGPRDDDAHRIFEITGVLELMRLYRDRAEALTAAGP